MDNFYSKLLSPLPSAQYESPIRSSVVAERKQGYHFLTERHIQAMWFEQKYFRELKTLGNETIKVLSPGIWNMGAGPDFRKAHLAIGDIEYFGDIEIHLSDESWEHHNHHTDPNYDHVVLHISLWHSRCPTELKNSHGALIQQAYLENCLTIPLARLAHLIDLDLYPYKKFVGSGQCAHQLFKKLPPEKISQFFEKAADWRLSRKRALLQSRIENPSIRIGAGLSMALGYKNNSEQFLMLYLELQKHQFVTEKEVLAWLLEKTRFFEPHFQQKWGENKMYLELKEISKTFSPTEAIHLHLTQIRPLNHPVRRLVALTNIYCDPTVPQILPKVFARWNALWASCVSKQKWKPIVEAFKDCLPSYTDPYWSRHYLFEKEPRKEFLPLIGENLKHEITLNLLLPLLEAFVLQKGNSEELTAFQQLYRALPASKSGKSEYLLHRFFGGSPKGVLLNNAYAEQGAYQLHYDFCSHFEASCEGCPFVERYKRL